MLLQVERPLIEEICFYQGFHIDVHFAILSALKGLRQPRRLGAQFVEKCTCTVENDGSNFSVLPPLSISSVTYLDSK